MKSIIAYSTISQIGYMLLASLVVPSFTMYHIVVHAFFKSLATEILWMTIQSEILNLL